VDEQKLPQYDIWNQIPVNKVTLEVARQVEKYNKAMYK
jgi:hypothetical protein